MSILLGVVGGLGLWIAVRSGRRIALTDALDSYSIGGSESRSRSDWFESAITKRLFRSSEVDLAIVGRSAHRQSLDCLVLLCTGAALPLLMHIVMAVGGVRVPLVLSLLASLVVGSLLAQVPRLSVRDQAVRMRRRFRTSFSAYLDLVSIMLAAGAGPETALVAASRIGSGPTFELVERALTVAQSSRVSPWEVLAEEGRRIGVEELPELAATVRLAGEQGARMTASLVAKASSLRHQHMAEIEAAANSATERMGIPLVLMFVSFLVLLGYPAVHLIGQGFTQ